MSLLRQIEKAKHRLEKSVENLLEAPLNYPQKTRNVSTSYKAHIAVLKHDAKKAKKNLHRLERELFKIKNHAPTARLELLAMLMIIFRPITKDEIRKLITFT